MLKMQSRPSQYSIPPSSGALQRASCGNTYPDLASGCNSYYNTQQQQQHSNHPTATLLHYNLPPITSYNSYSYYDGGVETTSNNPPGMQNENPNSPNGSISSTSNPQSPICVAGPFSPNGSNTESTTSSNSSPPLQYNSANISSYKYPSYSSMTPQYTSNNYSSTIPQSVYYSDNTTTNNAPYHAYYTNNHHYNGATGYSNPSSTGGTSLYSDYLNSGNPYNTPATSVTTATGTQQPNSSFALWNYPTLQVGQFSKVSYDTPRFKLTPERAIPLIKWFEEHKDHPYPSRHEKMSLCQSTQLTFTQVSTWFANARRRMKKATHEDDDDDELSEGVSDEERLK